MFRSSLSITFVSLLVLTILAGSADARRKKFRKRRAAAKAAKVVKTTEPTMLEKAGRAIRPTVGFESPAVRGLGTAALGLTAAVRGVAFVMTKPVLTHAPVRGHFHSTSGFGMRRHPILRRRKLHKGMDFAAGKRRRPKVVAAGDGVVVEARRRGGYGRLVIIDHGNGLTTRYAHLRRIRVRKGQKVSAGNLVGIMGRSGRATGVHLHFEVRVGKRAVDPELYAGFRSSKEKSVDFLAMRN